MRAAPTRRLVMGSAWRSASGAPGRPAGRTHRDQRLKNTSEVLVYGTLHISYCGSWPNLSLKAAGIVITFVLLNQLQPGSTG